MPVLQFKGKTAIERYHHTVPHHTLEFDGELLRSEWRLTLQSEIFGPENVGGANVGCY